MVQHWLLRFEVVVRCCSFLSDDPHRVCGVDKVLKGRLRVCGLSKKEVLSVL